MKKLLSILVLSFLFSANAYGETKSERSLCKSFMRAAESGKINDWKLAERSAKRTIADYPNNNYIKNCYAKAKNIYLTKKNKKNKKLTINDVIEDLEEFKSRPSIDWGKHHALKFIGTHPLIIFDVSEMMYLSLGELLDSRFLGLESVTKCSFKTRHKELDKYGGIKKFQIDFNKFDWNTLHISNSYENDYYKINIKCEGNCKSTYGYDVYSKKIKWVDYNSIDFFVPRKENMYSRIKKALKDLRKMCNLSTHKY